MAFKERRPDVNLQQVHAIDLKQLGEATQKSVKTLFFSLARLPLPLDPMRSKPHVQAQRDESLAN